MFLLVLFLLPFFFIFLKKTLFGATTKLPPGPNAWQVLQKGSEFRKEPHIAFTNLAKIHGPLMSLRLGGQIMIIASSAATAKEILKTQDRNFSGRFLPSVYYKVPSAEQSSLAMSKECNSSWKFLRGISQNVIFSSKSVESKAGLRKDKVVEMLEYLKTKQGKIVKLDELMNSTIINIISGTLVSRNLFDIRRDDRDPVHDLNNNDKNVRALIDELIEMVSSSLGLPDLFPVLRSFDFSSKGKATDIYRRILHIWEDMVKERRSERSSCDRRYASSSSPRDFLDVLLNNALPDDQICLIIMELLASGMDSTSITSVWLMVELIKHPHILRRVGEEIAEAFKAGNDHMLIDEEILTKSQYLQACIKETLRLHIPGPLLVPHRAIESCKIDNYVIPKDSIVVVNGWAISLDPNTWKDAASFNPDRFLDSGIDFRGTHFEYIPFGAGRRMCPGFNLAFKNVQIVVASLVHYFDWSLPDGMDPTEIDTADKFGTVLRKETPLLLIPSQRSK